MLVATIEIWPYGNEDRARVISKVFIANTREKSTRDGSTKYTVQLRRDGEVTEADDLLSSAVFYHRRSQGAEECVRKALATLPREETPQQ